MKTTIITKKKSENFEFARNVKIQQNSHNQNIIHKLTVAIPCLPYSKNLPPRTTTTTITTTTTPPKQSTERTIRSITITAGRSPRSCRHHRSAASSLSPGQAELVTACSGQTALVCRWSTSCQKHVRFLVAERGVARRPGLGVRVRALTRDTERTWRDHPDHSRLCVCVCIYASFRVYVCIC